MYNACLIQRELDHREMNTSPATYSSRNNNLILPSLGSSCHWLTQRNQRWGHELFWEACKKLQGGDLLAPTSLFLITTALTATAYKPHRWGEDSHCYWLFLHKKCAMGMTSPTKALGPEPAYWTAALNMQLPKICYSLVYFLKKTRRILKLRQQ